MAQDDIIQDLQPAGGANLLEALRDGLAGNTELPCDSRMRLLALEGFK